MVAALVVLGGPRRARALAPGPDGWIATGQGIRTVTLFKVKVCTVYHEMKSVPAAAPDRSAASIWALKDAVVDRDTDKRARLVMMRDVDPSRIRASFGEAYDNNGYAGTPERMANRATFLSALAGDLKEGDTIVVSYDAAAKRTTLTAPGGRAASVGGLEFMKATWRIWFGRGAEQVDLGDQMVANLLPHG
jgi:hypothetical protein